MTNLYPNVVMEGHDFIINNRIIDNKVNGINPAKTADVYLNNSSAIFVLLSVFIKFGGAPSRNASLSL